MDNKAWASLLLAVMLSTASFLTGCQSAKPRSPEANTAGLATRNNCYSLLYQLLDQQKDVSKLRFFKPEQSDLKDLVKIIAADSKSGAELLKKFAQEDPSIRLDDIQLPPGEVATRDSIADNKEKELLIHTGDTFELTLLLTQTEALSYAWHLAKVAAKNEPRPDHAQALVALSMDMEHLYNQVVALVRLRTISSPKNPV